MPAIVRIDVLDSGMITTGSHPRAQPEGWGLYVGIFSRKSSTGRGETHVVIWDETYDYDVVGESRHKPELLSLIAAAPPREKERGEVYVLARLEREPTNKYDKNAVKVTIDGKHVGYVPRDDAPAVGRFVASVEKQAGPLAVRAVIGWAPYKGDEAPIGVRLDMFDPSDGDADITLRPLSEIDAEDEATEESVAGPTPRLDEFPPPSVPPPPAALPPAAWYPNPQGAGQRYWDGQAWTEHYVP